MTDPLGSKTETDFDENGNVVETRFIGLDPATGAPQPPRVVGRRKYGDADRLIEVRDVFDAVTTFTYDERGNRTQVTDPTGVTRRMEYDARNRLVAVTDENGHRREMRYDLGGRLVAETDPNAEETTLAYDAAGRLVSRTDPLGNVTSFRVDGAGNRVGLTNPNANAQPGNPALVNAQGESETRDLDELGRLLRVIDAQDHVTQLEHDLLGNRTKVIDAKTQVTEFIHDDLGRLVEVIDPVVETPTDKRAQFVVDEAGNVIEATDREGHTVRITYDVLNRPVTRQWLTSGESETLAYDAFGNLAQIANSEVAYTFGYDAKNRLTSKLDSRLGRSLQFAYDAADRLIEKTDYQGDVTRLLYDGTGRLGAERNDAYLQVSYHFDPAGRLLNRILSNGAQTDYAYNAAGRLTSLTQRAADGTVVAASAFAHDANGNILGDGAGIYTYDPLDRLLSADLPGTAADRVYTYDRVGNRDTQTVGAESLDYVYGAGNRLLEIRRISDGTLVNSFEYDANGAVVAKRDGSGNPVYTLARDGRGRVVSATGPGFGNAFGYDPLGIRVRRDDSGGSHRFHLEGDRLEAVYGAGGTLREKYMRGSVIDEVVNAYLFDGNGKPTNLTYHHDPVTSVVAVTGHAGSVEETVAYSAFGETLGTTGASANTLRFTGRERDPDTGLYYFRARYYDPSIGRFLSEDPLGFGGGDVNLYGYVENNPLRFNDPTGLEINLTGHEAFGISGQVHVAVEFIPDNQAYWAGRLTQQTPDGRFYVTMSGDATGNASLSAPFGNLELVFDRLGDTYSDNFPIGPIGLPSGVSENQFGEMLINAANTYNQYPVPYNPAPDTLLSAFGGSNSTGGAFGLIQSQGGTLPDTSYILGGLGTEGAGSPPPLLNYGGMSYDYPGTTYSPPLVDAYCGGKC